MNQPITPRGQFQEKTQPTIALHPYFPARSQVSPRAAARQRRKTSMVSPESTRNPWCPRNPRVPGIHVSPESPDNRSGRGRPRATSRIRRSSCRTVQIGVSHCAATSCAKDRLQNTSAVGGHTPKYAKKSGFCGLSALDNADSSAQASSSRRGWSPAGHAGSQVSGGLHLETEEPFFLAVKMGVSIDDRSSVERIPLTRPRFTV